MSLSSLYRALRNYEGQVDYWQNSANTYARWIAETQEQIRYKEDQLAKARNALSKCSELIPANEEVDSELSTLGTQLQGAMEESAAPAAVMKINQENEGYIQGSINECNALIARLEEELRVLYEQLATYQEGLEYSNGRVAHYEACVDRTWDRINSYDDDDD